jgi:hypothetical protein
MQTIFSLSSLLVFPFWLMMACLPRWKWVVNIIASPLISAPAALLYAILVIPNIGGVFALVINPDVTTLGAYLATPAGVTVAWAHFLAFDLFVGRWAYLDAHQHKIHPLVMLPVLFMILMLGPVGFLLYLIVRGVALGLQPRGHQRRAKGVFKIRNIGL